MIGKRHEIRIEGASEPVSHYTDAVQFGDLLYVSGCAPFDSQGDVVGENDVVAQARQVLNNLRDIIRVAGAEMKDVLKVTVYLINVDDRKAINPVRQEFFGDARPASTLIGVTAFVHPKMLVEIEAVVGIPSAVDKGGSGR